LSTFRVLTIKNTPGRDRIDKARFSILELILFRHTYSYEIELRKIKIVLEDASRLKETYPPLVKDFLGKLKEED